MTPAWLLDNLLAWSAQVAVLVAFAAGAALTIKSPRARLFFWQGILVMAILLPVVEPWMHAVDGSVNYGPLTAAPILVTPHTTPRPGFVWRREYLLVFIAAGAMLRVLWMAIGFRRLRRHRMAAHVLTHPPVLFESSHVMWYRSDTISGPVTFGWLRPSILLPSRIDEFSDDMREAIACHELVHVRRHDWLFVIAEEILRAALWFHPAIWFVLSQIQLAREQTVDLEVIGLTRDRERYLDALVAVAELKIERIAWPNYRGSDVAPAPLFLKRRQLASRVAAVLKETPMSKARLFASLTTIGSAVLAAASIAVWFFPLQSPAQAAPQSADAILGDDPAITIDAGGLLMHRTPIFRGAGVTASGTVVVDATTDAKGEVSDARVVSGPDELRRPVLRSVLQWHYAAGSAGSTVRVIVKFDALPTPKPNATLLELQVPQTSTLLKNIVFAGAPPDVEQKVRSLLPVREGDQITVGTFRKVLEAAQQVDEHFRGNISINGAHEATVNLTLGIPSQGVASGLRGGIGSGVGSGVGTGVGNAQSPQFIGTVHNIPAATTGATPTRIRVGGNVQAENLILKVTPAYPALAKQARIQGVVQYTAIIGKDGTVQNLQLMSGHPLLVPAATDAVKQWVYKPTLLNGEPVEVITQIDVNFTLSQ